MNPIDVANGMRREPRQLMLPDVGNHPHSQKTVTGMVVLIILLLHMFRVMTVLTHHDSRMCDLLPTMVILFGCMLYTRDSFYGEYGTGLVKLTLCIVIAHMVLPNIWDAPETRWAEEHMRESYQHRITDTDP